MLWFLDPGADEIAAFRRVAEFVEERPIPRVEWFYKPNIDVPPDLGLGSRSILGGFIDQGMKVDVLVLIVLGVALTFPLFVLAFRSFTPAILAIVVVVLGGFVWTRGFIGLLSLFDVSLKERVYVSVAYANCIVQGTSFALHKYDRFYGTYIGEAAGAGDRADHWRAARSIDSLIGFAAILGVLGFATLYGFEVRAIRESAIMGAFGVVAVFVNAALFLPAIDCLVARDRAPRVVREPKIERTLLWLRAAGERLAPRRAGAILLTAIAVAALILASPGVLPTWTNHVEFAGRTVARQTANYLNQAGRAGYSSLEILIEPAGTADIRSPEFLAAATALVTRLRGLDDTRELSTVLTSVERVSRELFGHSLPRSRSEAGAVFNTIEGGLERALATNLYFQRGIRVSLQTAIERSDHLGDYIAEVLAIARGDFPELQVSPYGGNALFPRWDDYIRNGKPINTMASQGIVIALFMLRIYWFNRRRKAASTVLHPLWGGVLASVPFIFSISVVVVVMSITRIPLDAGTATVTALAINAAIDFSIYLIDEFQKNVNEGHAPVAAAWLGVQRKSRVILADALMNTCCFVPLLLSQFASLQNVALLMPVILLACAFGALVLMAAILPLAARRSAAAITLPTREASASQGRSNP